MGEDLGGSSVHGHAALVHHNQTAAKLRNLFHRVADHDDGSVLRLLVSADIFENGVPSRRVKTGGGLVQDQNVRFHGDNAGDGDAAFLPAGEVKGGFFQQILADANEARRPADPGIQLIACDPLIFGTECNVLPTGFLKKLVFRVLKDQSHTAANGVREFLVLPDILPLEKHLTGRWLQKPVQMLDQGGFSGACVTDHAGQFPRAKGQIDMRNSGMLKRRTGAVCMGQIFYLYDRFGRGHVGILLL